MKRHALIISIVIRVGLGRPRAHAWGKGYPNSHDSDQAGAQQTAELRKGGG